MDLNFQDLNKNHIIVDGDDNNWRFKTPAPSNYFI